MNTTHVLVVTNAYPSEEAPASGAYVEQQVRSLQEIGIDIAIMIVDRAQRGMRAYLGLRREVSDRVARLNPGIVHVMYGGVLADAVTRSVQDRPTVVSFCGSDLLGENFSGNMRRVISKYGIFASRRAARRASAIVVKSKNLYHALPNGIDRTKVRIIPNGVDLDVFTPLDRNDCRDRLGWNNAQFHLLFPTNSGDPCKRFGLAQRTVDTLKHMGVSVEIHQLRGVPHTEVPVWINASDAVLVTSAQEGSPNVVKEALACNVPVVSVDVGDVRERISGIDGCHIALPDPCDLATKIRKTFTEPVSVAGRRGMQDLSSKSVAFRLRDLYEQVLGRRILCDTSCLPFVIERRPAT